MEIHQSDHVKPQFGMQQQIPDPPTYLGDWHQQRVDVQWGYSDWKDFAKDMCHHWNNQHQNIFKLINHTRC